MILNKEIKRLIEKVSSIKRELTLMEIELDKAKNDWPSHQIIVGAEWYDRNVTPPKGAIWASDGLRVWLINSDGNPIQVGAIAVKFWTNAYIPATPSFISYGKK